MHSKKRHTTYLYSCQQVSKKKHTYPTAASRSAGCAQKPCAYQPITRRLKVRIKNICVKASTPDILTLPTNLRPINVQYVNTLLQWTAANRSAEKQTYLLLDLEANSSPPYGCQQVSTTPCAASSTCTAHANPDSSIYRGLGKGREELASRSKHPTAANRSAECFQKQRETRMTMNTAANRSARKVHTHPTAANRSAECVQKQRNK